jgi:hypothetical protein
MAPQKRGRRRPGIGDQQAPPGHAYFANSIVRCPAAKRTNAIVPRPLFAEEGHRCAEFPEPASHALWRAMAVPVLVKDGRELGSRA